MAELKDFFLNDPSALLPAFRRPSQLLIVLPFEYHSRMGAKSEGVCIRLLKAGTNRRAAGKGAQKGSCGARRLK
jgi:hypothetical protein